MKQLMILAVVLCLGACGGDTEPPFDTLPEGAGPPMNLSESASIATTLHALIGSTNGQLLKVLPAQRTDEERAAEVAKLCAEQSVTLHYSTTPETGGTAGIALTGSVHGAFTGADSSKVLLDLSGVFDAPFKIAQSGSLKTVQLTGNASLQEEFTAASGAGALCQTPPASSLAYIRQGTASGVFAISGSSGGKVAYEYTILQPDLASPPVVTGTAVLVSAGVEVHCTVGSWEAPTGSSSSCPMSAGMGEHCTIAGEWSPKVTCP